MGDETIAAIDRIFDALDKGADVAGHLFGRAEQHDRHPARRPKREVIEAEAQQRTPKRAPKAPTAPAQSSASASPKSALTRKPHFYIVEAIDPKSGSTIFVVTDGASARTECSTRAFATQILTALEKTP